MVSEVSGHGNLAQWFMTSSVLPVCPRVSAEIETIPYYAYRLLSTDLAFV